MKKIGLVALFALLLAGCDDGGEKKAQENLRKAEAALEKENFNEAKLQIDSIRIPVSYTHLTLPTNSRG